MAYQKTAKDKAWDRERTKLKSEITEWICKCGAKEAKIQEQTGRIAVLEQRIADLEAALEKFTNGKMTADEAVEDIRKSAEVHDMLGILTRNPMLGGYL